MITRSKTIIYLVQERCGQAEAPPDEDVVTVAVGGLLENPAVSYSLVETDTDTQCVLSLPPLPQRLMLDPLVSLVNETILLCSADYDSYRAKHHKLTQCWRLNLSRRPRVWVSVQSPLRSLFLSTLTSHGSKVYMLGGSEELLAGSEMSLMSGTRTVQTYDIVTNTWDLPPAQLPAPLFEGCAVSTSRGIVLIGDFEAGLPNAYISQGEGEDQWRPLPVSNFAHTNPGCSVVTITNVTGVLVISGLRAELLRLEDNKWIKLPQLKIRRFSDLRPTVGTSLGRVVVVGGVDRDTGQVSDVIEVWDEEEQDWVVSRQVMDNRRTRQTELAVPVRYMDSCNL